jgi:hypothetical protein
MLNHRLALTIFFITISFYLYAQESINRITTTVDTIEDNRLILVQECEVNASMKDVWEAYTTKSGWEGWAVPLAEVDWKINGTIRTNYNPKGAIGDSTTILIHVLNYVPYRFITLQSEITENFPDFMKEDEKALFNIIEFQSLNSKKTKIVSYGIGYKNNKKYQNLMKYFIEANEQTSLKLISYLEKNN